MTESSSSRKQFISALLAIADWPDAPLSALESEFAATLLAFGSETEDNIDCVDRIGVREQSDHHHGRVVGLALKTNNVLVSEILNVAEGSQLPADVREHFPELEQEDWDAVLRLATLILSALKLRLMPTGAAPHGGTLDNTG